LPIVVYLQNNVSLVKNKEGLSKVAVGRLSHSCLTFVDLVRLFPTYNLCDKREYFSKQFNAFYEMHGINERYKTTQYFP
jgi:hypothetical protein